MARESPFHDCAGPRYVEAPFYLLKLRPKLGLKLVLRFNTIEYLWALLSRFGILQFSKLFVSLKFFKICNSLIVSILWIHWFLDAEAEAKATVEVEAGANAEAKAEAKAGAKAEARAEAEAKAVAKAEARAMHSRIQRNRVFDILWNCFIQIVVSIPGWRFQNFHRASDKFVEQFKK